MGQMPLIATTACPMLHEISMDSVAVIATGRARPAKFIQESVMLDVIIAQGASAARVLIAASVARTRVVTSKNTVYVMPTGQEMTVEFGSATATRNAKDVMVLTPATARRVWSMPVVMLMGSAPVTSTGMVLTVQSLKVTVTHAVTAVLDLTPRTAWNALPTPTGIFMELESCAPASAKPTGADLTAEATLDFVILSATRSMDVMVQMLGIVICAI
jgi:hypothetical protein